MVCGPNRFEDFLHRVAFCFRRTFVVGSCLTGGLWLGGFCPKAFCWGLMTGYRKCENVMATMGEPTGTIRSQLDLFIGQLNGFFYAKYKG